MVVRLVNDATALLSMRESDFDVHSAYGEVVDNSIQADAKKIKIKILYEDGAKERISYVAFGDDGEGMGKDILHKCLQLGYSSRYNDRSGIGRFGVGATLAAINQCMRVEVYSKRKNSDWMHTYVDLEPLILNHETGDVELPIPTKKAPPADLKDLCGKDHGTLVIWKKYDRAPYKASKIIEESIEWMGRTFRHFIWDGVELSLNGQIVPAVDPLYIRTEKTKFPSDPPAKAYDDQKISWPVSSLDNSGKAESSEIVIRMSLLPVQFRPNKGSGNSSENEKRYINHNNGISIVRNKREVFYGPIPNWPGEKIEEIDRWWGCEISFNAVLDRSFTVKNIKRGAVPELELKKVLAARINPTRGTALEEVREVWAKEQEGRVKKLQETTGVSGGHEEAELAAKGTPAPKNVIDQKKDRKAEAKKASIEFVKDETKQAGWAAKFESQPFSILDGEWRGPHFFETRHMGGTSALVYNQRHPFFQDLNQIRGKLSVNSEGANSDELKLVALIDILIMSYGKAEAMMDPSQRWEPEALLESLRMTWGQFLQSYLKAWSERNGVD